MALLLLFLFSSALLSPTAALTVRDNDGDALQPNSGVYYMIAVRPSSAGGVTIVGHDPHGNCPNKLGLSSSTDRGIPVVIVPDDATAKKVEVGKPVKFHFAFIYRCVPNTEWGVDWDPVEPNYLVPNIESPELFTIHYDKSSRSYFLEGVGVLKIKSELFLATGDSQGFRFVFKKYRGVLESAV